MAENDRYQHPHARAPERLRRASHGSHLHDLAVVLVVLLWASLACSQPTVGTPCAASVLGGSASISCTATGVNRWVGLGVTLTPKTDNVSSISYGSGGNNPPSQIIAIEHATHDVELRLYGMVAPATGSQTVAVSTGGGTDIEFTVTPMADVSQTTPTGTANSGSSTSAATYTTNVTTVATDRVLGIGCCFFGSGLSFTPGAGQTEILDTDGDGTGHACEVTHEVHTASPTTMSGTYAQAIDGCLVVAVPVKLAVAAPPARRVGPMVWP